MRLKVVTSPSANALCCYRCQLRHGCVLYLLAVCRLMNLVTKWACVLKTKLAAIEESRVGNATSPAATYCSAFLMKGETNRICDPGVRFTRWDIIGAFRGYFIGLKKLMVRHEERIRWDEGLLSAQQLRSGSTDGGRFVTVQ